MEDNIKYAYAWRSRRLQNSFTAFGSNGDSLQVTATVPKSIKTFGGLVKHLYECRMVNEANKLVRQLREMEARNA